VGESSKSRTIEIRVSTLVTAACLFVVAIAIGVGAYLIGKGSGEDLDAAHVAGAEAGQSKGVAAGTARGYAVGFKRGREKAFERAYAPAYRESYTAAFEEAGLEAPTSEQIAIPSP
jgi:hypothetical protein